MSGLSETFSCYIPFNESHKNYTNSFPQEWTDDQGYRRVLGHKNFTNSYPQGWTDDQGYQRVPGHVNSAKSCLRDG